MKPLLLTLNLQDDSILLNEGILDALDRPRQVQVMLNEDAGMLLLRACTIDDLQAVVIPAGQHILQCEISGRTLLRKLRKFTGWEDDQPRVCEGEYLAAHHAIRFDMSMAKPLPDSEVAFGEETGNTNPIPCPAPTQESET